MYNTNSQFSSEKFDELFLRCVILEVFRRDSILNAKIDETKLEFVKTLFSYHTKGLRLESFKLKTKKIIGDLFQKFKCESENTLKSI